jgi:hypothetical protein
VPVAASHVISLRNLRVWTLDLVCRVPSVLACLCWLTFVPYLYRRLSQLQSLALTERAFWFSSLSEWPVDCIMP